MRACSHASLAGRSGAGRSHRDDLHPLLSRAVYSLANENTMFHLLSREVGQVTVVVDNAAADEMRNILATIRHSLKDQSIHMGGHEHLAEAA